MRPTSSQQAKPSATKARPSSSSSLAKSSTRQTSTPPRRREVSPKVPTLEDSYADKASKTVKVSPFSWKKQKGEQVEGETSAPSGLAGRQGNEPLGEDKPMTKAMRPRRKKTAIPTQKPVLTYNPLRNYPYFVR